MLVDARHTSRYLRLVLAGLVVLTLLPVCIMLACTTACGCPDCAQSPMSSGCPDAPMAMLRSLTTIVEPLILAFVALLALLPASRVFFDGRFGIVSYVGRGLEPLIPPDPRHTLLLI